MTHEAHVRCAHAFVALYNDRDWEAAVRLVTHDVELTNMATGRTYRGAEGVRRYMEGWVSSFPDSTIEATSVFADEQGAVVEFIGRGRRAGRLDFGATSDASQAEARFCQVLEMRGNKVWRLRLYYDLTSMLEQLGITMHPTQTGKSGPRAQEM